MAISGDVSIMGLPQVFEMIANNALDGVLSVASKRGRVRIPFSKGVIHLLLGAPERPRSGQLQRGALDAILDRGQALRPASGVMERPRGPTANDLPPPRPKGAPQQRSGPRGRPPSGPPARPRSGPQDRPASRPPSGAPRPRSGPQDRPAQDRPAHHRPAEETHAQRGRPGSSRSEESAPEAAPRLGPHGWAAPGRGQGAGPRATQRGAGSTPPRPGSSPEHTPPQGSAAEPERTRQSQRPQRRGSRDLVQDVLLRARNLDLPGKRAEVSEVILAAFAWTPATFSFAAAPDQAHLDAAAQEGRTLAIDPAGLVLEAARRLDESEREGSGVSLVDPAWGSSVRIREGFLAGTLEGVGLAAVLQTLQSERLSGALSISGQGGEQRLLFHEGEVFLWRNDGGDGAALSEFLGESWADKLVFAQVAASRGGRVSEDDLPEEEATALKEAFFDTLFWDDAQFEFLLGALPEDFDEPGEGRTRIALRSERFLLEAVQRLQEWDDLRRQVGGGEAIYRFSSPGAKLEAVQTFGPPELLTLIDGRMPLNDLARRTGLEYLEVARVLADLLTIGLIARE
ncbi:MAG: DUF4388 domain-containing protein [Planctomycetota bacterium]